MVGAGAALLIVNDGLCISTMDLLMSKSQMYVVEKTYDVLHVNKMLKLPVDFPVSNLVISGRKGIPSLVSRIAN